MRTLRALHRPLVSRAGFRRSASARRLSSLSRTRRTPAFNLRMIRARMSPASSDLLTRVDLLQHDGQQLLPEIFGEHPVADGGEMAVIGVDILLHARENVCEIEKQCPGAFRGPARILRHHGP